MFMNTINIQRGGAGRMVNALILSKNIARDVLSSI